MMRRSHRMIGFALCSLLTLLGSDLFSQAATPIPFATKDNYRLFFDQKAGFKVSRLDVQDGVAHPLLNPTQDFPVSVDIFANNGVIPLVMLDTESPQSDDPGYRGPAFQAGDIKLQLWGLDLQSSGSSWFAVRYELQNNGKSLNTISIRLVLDTWLGENDRNHLVSTTLSNGNTHTISDESRILPQDSPQLVGGARAGSNDGFFLLLASQTNHLLLPQRLIVANVRRLQNSDADFAFEEHRAFNLLPFSVNDSAIGIFYDSVGILPNQKVFFDVIFNGQADSDINHANAVIDKLSSIKPTISKLPVASTIPLNPAALKNNDTIQRLNSLIEQLDAMMKDPHYRQGDLEKLINAINDAQKKLQSPGP